MREGPGALRLVAPLADHVGPIGAFACGRARSQPAVEAPEERPRSGAIQGGGVQ